jgi:ATP-binding protein involved in chromosome partitioning
MARVTEAAVMAALKALRDPASGRDLVTAGMVQGLTVKDGNVQFVLEVDPAQGAGLEPLRQQAEQAVLALAGVASATAILTAHRNPAAAQPRPATHHENHAHAQGPAQRPPLPGAGKAALPNIRSVIAVASGKGGVGKSTTAANLALALQAQGLKVGLLDADIYGPSQPRLMGLTGRPDSPDGKTIVPHRVNGLPVMSIGFLVAEDTAMIWRGPMVQSALMQMLRDVQWGQLDCLVVDLPPGTGDAQLTMAQQVPLTGAVIVSTPQDIALLDVKKSIAMFRKVDVPILGLVENMSVFVCPNCGHESHVFSHGGARREADKQGIRFLGEVPLDLRIRETSDAGRPIVLHFPDSPQAAGYRAIARQVWAAAEEQLAGGTRQGPKITMQ